MNSGERIRRYVDAALAGACDDVAASGPGGRNETLNAAAYGLGRLVGASLLGRDEAEAELVRSCPTGRDFSEREARYTVRRAMAEGERNPRAPEPADGWRPTQRRGPTPATVRAPVPEPARPDTGEVAALWAGAVAVDSAAWEGPPGSDPLPWLQSRGLDADAVAAADLARAIQDGLPLPSWAMYGTRTWADAGFRLVVRAWGPDGGCLSVHARNTANQAEGPKTLWPRGYEARGLVFANEPARRLLAGEGAPQLCVIVEGVPDWLTWATRGRGELAVFGVAAGSWCAELARRVPDGSEVVIRTHRDEAGEKYATSIIDSFHGRAGVRLQRGGLADG